MEKKEILKELGEHLPYSVFGVIAGLVLLGIMSFIGILVGGEEQLPVASEELFHVFHPVHMLLSACVTTAMFWKHEKRFVKALVIGVVGSVGICGTSDIFLPFLSGTLLGVKMHLHICILGHPQIILPFLVVGILIGLLIPQVIEKSTQYSHSMHVLISSMASLLYLTSFGFTEWMHHTGTIFIITILSVMIPCCISDIVFPLLLTRKQE